MWDQSIGVRDRKETLISAPHLEGALFPRCKYKGPFRASELQAQ